MRQNFCYFYRNQSFVMKTKKETCKNCEQQFNEGFKFCPHCGQQAKDELTVKVLFYNTISNYFSFDARFFKSFLPLLFKPGYLASKFIEGKRLLYLHPAQMYLFIAIVFFFLFSFIQRSQVQSLNDSLAKTLKKDNSFNKFKDEGILDSLKLVQEIVNEVQDSITRAKLLKSLNDNDFIEEYSKEKIDSLFIEEVDDQKRTVTFDFDEKKVDSLIEVDAPEAQIHRAMGMEQDAGYIKKRMYKQALKFYKSRSGGSILQAFYDAIPIAMFFLLPIFALFLKLFYRKHGLYAHHLVFSFYYFSFLFTVFSIIIGINFIFDIPDWLDWLLAFSTFVYLYLALRRFYNQSRFKTLVKASVTSILFLIFVAPLTAAVLGMFAFLFY